MSERSIATYVLPPLLGAFQKQYPGLTITLTSANTQAIAVQAADYRLDVAVVEGPVSDARLVSAAWRNDELVVIAAPAHPLAQQPAVPLACLVDQPFIAREAGSGTRAVAEQALRAQGITLRTTLELGSTEAIKQAVAADLGLAIVSRATIGDQLALGTLAVLSVPELYIPRPLIELLRAGRTLSPAATAFAPFLRPTTPI